MQIAGVATVDSKTESRGAPYQQDDASRYLESLPWKLLTKLAAYLVTQRTATSTARNGRSQHTNHARDTATGESQATMPQACCA